MASDLPTRVKRKDPEMICHQPSDSSLFSKTKKSRSPDGELAVFVKEKTATVHEPEPMECEEAKGELMDAEHEREQEGRPSGVGDRGFHQLQEQSNAPDPPPNTAASLLLWVLLRNGSSNSREEDSISAGDICRADASLGIENQLCSARYRREGNMATLSMVPLRVEQHTIVSPLSLQHHGQQYGGCRRAYTSDHCRPRVT